MEDIERLSRAVGSHVTLKANTLELTAELTECKAVGGEASAAVSVLFETSQREAVPQQIFGVSGKEVGDMSLFLVPIGPGDKGMVYEAVINSGPAATP